jgi:chromosome segregation ATPase
MAIREGGSGMGETSPKSLTQIVDVFRSVVADWDVFVKQFDGLTKANDELRERSERQERQLLELQESFERLRQESEESGRTLAALRTQYQALQPEHETLLQAHRELRERHEGLRQDREFAAGELEALLRRLKP